jgi:hypothetical protein
MVRTNRIDEVPPLEMQEFQTREKNVISRIKTSDPSEIFIAKQISMNILPGPEITYYQLSLKGQRYLVDRIVWHAIRSPYKKTCV